MKPEKFEMFALTEFERELIEKIRNERKENARKVAMKLKQDYLFFKNLVKEKNLAQENFDDEFKKTRESISEFIFRLRDSFTFKDLFETSSIAKDFLKDLELYLKPILESENEEPKI